MIFWAVYFRGDCSSEIIQHLNIAYASEHPKQRLDVFRPADDAHAPLLILIHGGGWFRGERAWTYQNAIFLAQHGYAVATLGYRQVRDYPDWRDKHSALMWENMKSDIMRGAQYLVDHEDSLGIDASRAIMVGSSAGGQLALAMKARAADWVSEGIAERAPKIVGAVAHCPASDLTKVANPYLRALETNVPPEDINPVRMAASKFEGVMLIHGDADSSVPLSQSEDFMERLFRNDVNARLTILPGVGHGYIYELGLDASLAPEGSWKLPPGKHLAGQGKMGFDAMMEYIVEQPGYEKPYTPFYPGHVYHYYSEIQLFNSFARPSDAPDIEKEPQPGWSEEIAGLQFKITPLKKQIYFQEEFQIEITMRNVSGKEIYVLDPNKLDDAEMVLVFSPYMEFDGSKVSIDPKYRFMFLYWKPHQFSAIPPKGELSAKVKMMCMVRVEDGFKSLPIGIHKIWFRVTMLKPRDSIKSEYEESTQADIDRILRNSWNPRGSVRPEIGPIVVEVLDKSLGWHLQKICEGRLEDSQHILNRLPKLPKNQRLAALEILKRKEKERKNRYIYQAMAATGMPEAMDYLIEIGQERFIRKPASSPSE